MKQCPTCQEEFTDQFAFCPVDGTPLFAAAPAAAQSVASAQADESVTAGAVHGGHTAASGGNGAGPSNGFHAGEETVASLPRPERGEYHLTFLEDEGLTRRLTKEIKSVAHDAELTWPEFKKDPLGFTGRSVTAYSRAGWKFFSQRNQLPFTNPQCIPKSISQLCNQHPRFFQCRRYRCTDGI